MIQRGYMYLAYSIINAYMNFPTLCYLKENEENLLDTNR